VCLPLAITDDNGVAVKAATAAHDDDDEEEEEEEDDNDPDDLKRGCFFPLALNDPMRKH